MAWAQIGGHHAQATDRSLAAPLRANALRVAQRGREVEHAGAGPH